MSGLHVYIAVVGNYLVFISPTKYPYPKKKVMDRLVDVLKEKGIIEMCKISDLRSGS